MNKNTKRNLQKFLLRFVAQKIERTRKEFGEEAAFIHYSFYEKEIDRIMSLTES